MTRISLEPAGLRRAAGALRDVATEHRRSASRLVADGLPSMPPELVGRYQGRLRGLAEALDALAGDSVLMDALGAKLAESYLAVRRSEWASYSEGDEAFEQQGHFSKY